MISKVIVEFLPGTSIEAAAVESVRLATLVNTNVEFEFNEIRLLARPGGCSDCVSLVYQLGMAREQLAKRGLLR